MLSEPTGMFLAFCQASCRWPELAQLAYWTLESVRVSVSCSMLQADSFYSLMQSAQPDSQVETHLVDLLDFDKFALIKMLVQNRLKVVWCMRLNRAQSDEEHTRIQVCISCIIWLLHRLSLYAIFAHNKRWNHAACQVHDRVVSGTPFALCCLWLCPMFAPCLHKLVGSLST